MTKLNTEEKIALYEQAATGHFKKRGTFIAREAIPGETCLTIVCGKLETLKTASENEVVLRNIEIGSSAETYIIKKSDYLKRYDITEKTHSIDGQVWTVVLAKGEIYAFKYTGPPIAIVAIWEEEMLVEEGDYIARPVGGLKEDIYRIEKTTFAQTYFEIND